MIKRVVPLVCMVLSYLVTSAQFSSANALLIRELVSYSRDAKGFYVKNQNRTVDAVNRVEKYYAFDKKTKNLYMLTENSNVVVTLNDYYSKIYKKNKTVLKLSGETLQQEIEMRNRQLDKKFEELNQRRQKEIQDSIKKVEQDAIEAEKRRKAQIEAEQRIREQAQKAREEYLSNHRATDIPLGKHDLICTICDKTIESADVVATFAIHNDSIYYATHEDGVLGLKYVDMHVSMVPEALRSDKHFKYHYQVFKDSLNQDDIDYGSLVQYWRYESLMGYMKQVRKTAPYGFVEDWGWGTDYNMVTFNISYVNTNAKTIKYLTIYFKITNDVGDTRTTGYFQGTGPVKEWESSSWEWDSSRYRTANDATKMHITKIVITYMNGSKQTIPAKNIWYNNVDNDDD